MPPAMGLPPRGTTDQVISRAPARGRSQSPSLRIKSCFLENRIAALASHCNLGSARIWATGSLSGPPSTQWNQLLA